MLKQWNIRDRVRSHPETRGWFMGNFIPEWDFFHSDNVELKYHQYKKWEKHIGSTTNTKRKTLTILISGKVRFSFSSLQKEYILEKPFDYVADDEIPWNHEIEAIEDSLLLVVRQLHP